MGKKVKIGKQRKDKFYQLAKESGYRSRAAFKLIQLNRKYEFLQKSRVLVDLCAAPGGWLQVATQCMPVSSLIIGVDLVPIKPIHNVITFEADITTGKCKQALKKHLKTWKVDVVLHDGAPNVGKNWLHDAFQQNQLTLQALKLATEFLMKGGWFVTKVFRSKDYNALVWVFQQFFKKVFATKPQASRTESAEIFVVCQHYKAPDRIDPKFLDAKYVFEEVDPDPKAKLNLMFPEKQRKRAEGYPEGDNTLYHRVPVSDFVQSNHHIELLNDCSEIVFNDETIANHATTTDEIKECCKDIKVLGRKELRLLLSWRKKLQDILYPKAVKQSSTEVTAVTEEDEEAKVQKQIEELQMQQVQESKRKKKKVLKDKKKLRDKMNLKMVLPHDEPIQAEDKSLFQLSMMKNKEQLQEVNKGDLEFVDKALELADVEDSMSIEGHPKYVSYDKDDKNFDGLYSNSEAEEEDSDDESLGSLHEEETVTLKKKEMDEITESEEVNPLLVDLDNSTSEIKKKKKVDMWFSKDVFEGLEVEADEDFEIDQISKYYDAKGALTKSKTSETKKDGNKKKMEKYGNEDDESNEDDDTDSDDSDSSAYNIEAQHPNLPNANGGILPSLAEDKVPHTEKAKKKKRKLDVEGLALGSMMIASKKTKRDIIDMAWNRYTFADENLPDWFTKEEEKHNRKQVPVTKEMVEEYKQKLKEINARSIHKVAEAKARKKRKASKKQDKARKKVEAIADSLDMTDQEKMQQIKTIYKKAGVGAKQKKEVTYVVAKKSRTAKRVSRPAGVKGHFKVVDPRMKKDNMKKKATAKTQMKRGKKRKH